MKIIPFLLFSLSLFSDKLVNVESGSVVVEFIDGKARFSDCFLEIEMKQTGIYIPASMQQDYDMKEVIYLGDLMFEKAFIDVYYPLSIANSLYQWQN